MKKTMRLQLILILIAVIAAVLLIVGLSNVLLLGRFYQNKKKNVIVDAYGEVSVLIRSGGAEKDAEAILVASAKNNLEILVTDQDFHPVVSTAADDEEVASRLFGFYTGLYHDDVKEIEKKDTYTVQKTTDRSGITYLEIWGAPTEQSFCLIRTPMAQITESVAITNRFFLIAGLAAVIAAACAIWIISRRFTAPLRELSDISSRMAQLDFDTRYEPQKNEAEEIRELGQHFNMMSDELEKAITGLKSANAELRRDVEKRMKIDEMRVEFLNNVSHELKTPIALIQGYAEGLRDNIADDEESRAYYTDVIIDESGKMNHLVMQLLSLNRLEFGNEQLRMEPFDLTELIEGVLQGMDIMIRQNGAAILFDNSRKWQVWGDSFKIEEVVTNYLSNAIHHLEGEKKIEIRIVREGKYGRTSVFNTGKPVPEKDLPHLFEKFYKVDKARTRLYGGSGIGLSIVKAIMDAHGMQCGVKNYENGVSFYFTLEAR